MEKTDYSEVGLRISRLMVQQEMSGADLAKKLDLTPARVAQIRNGQSITLDVLIKISEIFDISVEYLLNGDKGYVNVNIYNTHIDEIVREKEAYNILSDEVRDALEEAHQGILKIKQSFEE